MLFTQEHEELRRTVRNFIEKEVNPFVPEWEAAGRFPIHDVFKKMGDLGLLGVTKPEEYGGMGLDYSYGLIVAEEIGGATCGGVPLSIGVQTDMATPALARFGSDELKRDYLAPAIAGDMVASIAVSEPHAGSDVANIKTNAKKDGDDYVINGTKMWITNSPSADFFCLLANTSDDKPHVNKSLIVVPKDAGGITVDKPLNKLGMRSSETAQVFFDDVRVPQRNLIGQEGMGFMMQMMQFQEERLWGAANAIKGCENLIAQTIDYARERQVFGMSLLDNQSVHFKLAELQTEVEMLRALVWQACETYINGGDVLRLASMAKLKAGRTATWVTERAIQILGGYGYTREYPVERWHRDAKIHDIFEGTEQIQQLVISRAISGLRIE